MARSRITTQEELRDAELRLYYETKLGKEKEGIRLSQWRDIKNLMTESGLALVEANFDFIALVKLGSIKGKQNSAIVKDLFNMYTGLLKAKGRYTTVPGFELWKFADKVAYDHTGNHPADVNIYRWFNTKTDKKGYFQQEQYSLSDIIKVVAAAATYRPKAIGVKTLEKALG